MEKGGAYNWGGACEGQGLAVAWASEGWGLWQRVGLLQGGVAYAEGAWFVMENSCWGLQFAGGVPCGRGLCIMGVVS